MIEKIKQAAIAVKGWSNCNKAWLDHSEDEPAAVVGHITDDGDTYPVATIDCDQYDQSQDSIKLARFYAAANPQSVLEIIELLATRDAEIAELRKNDARYNIVRTQGVEYEVETGIGMFIEVVSGAELDAAIARQGEK